MLVLHCVFTGNEDVVNVDEDPVQAIEEVGQDTLKDLRGTSYPKGQTLEAKKPFMGDERGVLTGVLIQFKLMESGFCIKNREHCGLMDLCFNLFHCVGSVVAHARHACSDHNSLRVAGEPKLALRSGTIGDTPGTGYHDWFNNVSQLYQ